MMQRIAVSLSLAGAVTVGVTGAVSGAEPQPAPQADRVRQLEARVQQLQSRVIELEDRDDRDWMTRRRAEQVKALVRDVLDDAETRAALLDEGVTAGHDGHFFLKSADGAFLLELAGHLQVRYIYNHRRGAHAADPDADDNEAGFQIRRAKFKGEGHIGDPRLTYDFSLAADRDSKDTIFEDYTLGYAFTDNLSVTAGRWKQPFARQEMVSSSRQLAVERSLVHERFNVGRGEGVGLTYATDRFNAYGTFTNGMESSFDNFTTTDGNFTDAAFVGRVETLIAGEWSQFKDPGTAWRGQPTGAMAGAAVYYQIDETGNDDPNDKLLLWTVDASLESGGFGVFAAGYGRHADNEMDADYDDFGLLVESGYFLVPDKLQPYVRYELIIQDDRRTNVVSGANNEYTNLVTAGVNWYQHKHDAKFTVDVVYAFDPLNGFVSPSDGLGLLEDADRQDGQAAVRAQYQLKW